MEEILNQIVKLNVPPEERIDVELLKRYTRRTEIVMIRWNRVRRLYLLGADRGLAKGFYVDQSGQWVLLMGARAWCIRNYLGRCGNNLERLYILDTDIAELNVKSLTGLRELALERNWKLRNLEGLFKHPWLETLILKDLPMLNRLTITSSAVKKLRIADPLPGLLSFLAVGCPLEDADFLPMLPNVKEVRLNSAPITGIPSLEELTCLETLGLSNCPILSLDGVVLPENLRYLFLDKTKICRVPDAIRNLPYLMELELLGLHLKELPDWLPELGLTMGRSFLSGINLENTTVEGVDMSIFDQPQEVIRAWFEARKTGRQQENDGQQEIEQEQPLNELKVVFLGDGGAGKSRTIARLLLDGEQTEDFPNVSTPGIVIQDKYYNIGERNVKVHFWDFGGQDILHSMHRMFLTERTLYVVMLNVRDGTQTERGRYWLHNIRSFAKDAPVLLVLNQIDTNRNASVNMPDLRNMYPALTEEVKMSALEDDPPSIQNNLIAALERQIGAFPTLESPFLPAWSRLKERLHGMEDYYIRGDEFERYCAECGVEDSEEIRMALLRWFSDLGVSFHYGNSFKLKNFVILRPDWLTNAIYTIIFNKREDTDNGLISHEAIHQLLSSNSPQIRRAIPELVYQKHEVDYVLDVIRKFRLSFLVGDDTEFIPMLCRADSLPIAAAYENDPDTLEFRMEYEYLPNNVIHRLMVDLRRDLDTSQVWLTGALFRQESNGLSAVVKTEGDVLRIFVKGEIDLHRPHTYLNTIRDALAAIQRDMGLTPPEYFVVYKKDGKSERFLYEMLTGSLDSGIPAVYSQMLRRAIPIIDILDQSDREVERKKQKLLEDVAGACVRMQSKKILWKAPEDDRNTELRDLLWSMGYRVADQSLAGVGAGGKRAGELDLLILNEQNLPWMVCEAMNIKNNTLSQIDYWNVHLNKLLVNYNAPGVRDLLLVSYVSANAEEFSTYWQTYSEHMRWYDPPGVIRREGTYEACALTQKQFGCLRVARCTYDRGGMPTTVYHYFLRLGI